MYIARQSLHIQSDIQRNWSSWNFGQDGITCTYDELQAGIADALENEQPIYISGFELWGDELRNADIRELYPNYWVLVDNVNGGGAIKGIFGIELNSETLQDAISEAQASEYSGEGVRFDAQSAKLVWSCPNNEIHIFEV